MQRLYAAWAPTESRDLLDCRDSAHGRHRPDQSGLRFQKHICRRTLIPSRTSPRQRLPLRSSSAGIEAQDAHRSGSEALEKARLGGKVCSTGEKWVEGPERMIRRIAVATIYVR